MTDLPYTDDDLRAEAARQLAELADHLDADRVGQQMCGAEIASQKPEPHEDGTTDPDAQGWEWDEVLDGDQFDTAERAVHDLMNGAADTSGWAVALGVTGLEPGPVHAWTTPGVGYEAAIQIATSPEITDEARERLSTEIRRAVGVVVCRVLGRDQVEGGAL